MDPQADKVFLSRDLFDGDGSGAGDEKKGMVRLLGLDALLQSARNCVSLLRLCAKISIILQVDVSTIVCMQEVHSVSINGTYIPSWQ